jgi:ABC-type polysaccharide/polyol phosphate transport system ATPase subunit
MYTLARSFTICAESCGLVEVARKFDEIVAFAELEQFIDTHSESLSVAR